mmetsp:Transcript_44672/g.83883  ORF Transcript_44672/g.83883 Transcript_44672/m.83883 type:complete len:173 (-) Transcript_44672:171-689(-)
MIKAGLLLCISIVACKSQPSPMQASLTLQDYFGEYYFGGDTRSGSVLVTPAGKTRSGAQYNAPYSDLQDFPSVVNQEDLKDSLWVWLPGSNAYNGEGWYHHDTIYKVQMKSSNREMIGYTGDMQRLANGKVSRNQGKAAMQIYLKGNALVMSLSGGFGGETWVHYLPSSPKA